MHREHGLNKYVLFKITPHNQTVLIKQENKIQFEITQKGNQSKSLIHCRPYLSIFDRFSSKR